VRELEDSVGLLNRASRMARVRDMHTGSFRAKVCEQDISPKAHNGNLSDISMAPRKIANVRTERARLILRTRIDMPRVSAGESLTLEGDVGDIHQDKDGSVDKGPDFGGSSAGTGVCPGLRDGADRLV
jgi:hypothetical protein